MTRAKALLAVASGQSFTNDARTAGRRSGDAVEQVVTRSNRHGLVALESGRGGGQPKCYTLTEQERILREVQRAPDRDKDKTATWSLSTLQGALRRAPDGLAGVSTYNIWCVLRQARRQRARERRHTLSGSGAYTRRPLQRQRVA